MNLLNKNNKLWIVINIKNLLIYLAYFVLLVSKLFINVLANGFIHILAFGFLILFIYQL